MHITTGGRRKLPIEVSHNSDPLGKANVIRLI